MDVSLVIPTYRRPARLEQTLQRLATVRFSGSWEIVVADDSPAGEALEVMEAYRTSARVPVRYVEVGGRGAAAARNLGAELATGDYLIFLDDDMLVESDHLQLHVGHLSSRRAVLVNGHWEFPVDARRALEADPFGRFRLGIETWIKDGIPQQALGEHATVPAGISACNLGIRRALFDEIGGFDEDFPTAGYEDQDFSVRAKARGCDFVYDRRIRLLHNDERHDRRQFEARVQRGAMTAVLLANKYPDNYAREALVVENAPISRRDPWVLVAKKLAKKLASSIAGRFLYASLIALLERIAPRSRLLQVLYWQSSGVNIYLGVREGIRHWGRPPVVGRSGADPTGGIPVHRGGG